MKWILDYFAFHLESLHCLTHVPSFLNLVAFKHGLFDELVVAMVPTVILSDRQRHVFEKDSDIEIISLDIWSVGRLLSRSLI